MSVCEEVILQKRASGEIMTLASWMREFVANHADYKHDSFVSDLIVYDMLKTVSLIRNNSVDIFTIIT